MFHEINHPFGVPKKNLEKPSISCTLGNPWENVLGYQHLPRTWGATFKREVLSQEKARLLVARRQATGTSAQRSELSEVGEDLNSTWWIIPLSK